MILETLQQRQWYFAQIVCLAALNSSMLIILCPYPSGSNNSEWEWNSEISLQILTYRQQLAKLWYSVLEVAVPWCTTQFCCFLILRAQVRNQLNTSEHFSINLQRQAVKKQATLDIVLLIHQFLIWTTVRASLCCGATCNSITTCKTTLMHTNTDSKQTHKAGNRLCWQVSQAFCCFWQVSCTEWLNIFPLIQLLFR